MKDLIRTPIITSGIISDPVGPMIGAAAAGGGGDPLAVFDLNITDGSVTDHRGNSLTLSTHSGFTNTPSIVTSTDVPNANYSHSFRVSSEDAQGVLDLVLNDTSQLSFDTTEDFTIEWWQKREDTIPDIRARWLNAAGDVTEHYLRYQTWSTSGSTLRLSAGTFTGQLLGASGVWEHVALVRESGTLKQYDDGVLDSNAGHSSAFDLHEGGYMAIGYRPLDATPDNSGPNMLVAMLRVYKGLAKYTGNFTPE